ncbi:MAG TPA: carboxypeptidase-like regulatory domain-containing protein [Terracidiphilus sp.]|nr:carboxypeptidase-like regulatory domain-containing protein [Terracidiphilus sp.]
MRYFRLQSVAIACSLLIAGAFVCSVAVHSVYAQSDISGDLTGTVTDPSGASIVGATITVTYTATGAVSQTKSNSTGSFRVSLLKPGAYTLKVSAPGFRDTASAIEVSVGRVTTENIRMALGAAAQTVEVSANEELLQVEDADVSTAIDLEQTQNLPNPGNDLTFWAQTSPGAIMNTQGGYGNFEVFGLPATSNNFTLNGGQEDDPFLNLNNSGPSNLLLGNNDIAEVNVITNAYSSEYGTFGGAQVTSISRSGGNKFHGNANYWYNGTIFNANNWLLNNQGAGRPGDVDNQWAAAIGGPIVKDKTFFFVDYEGIRFVTTNTGGVYIPSPSFETTTLDNIQNSTDSEVASEYNFYKNNIFGTYNAAPGASHAVATSDPDVLTFESASKLALQEWFMAARIDQNIGANDHAFFHVKIDRGLQPTYADPLTTAFDANSFQPDYEAQLGYTHTFSPNMVNQFLLAGSYYGAVFKMADASAANAISPETLDFIDGSFTSLNNDGFAFPQGRNVTQYQVQDDLSITKGKTTLKFGGFFKRDDVSDFDIQQFTTPLMFTEKDLLTAYGETSSTSSFANGGVFEEYFNRYLLNPAAGDQPVGISILGAYAEADWKPVANFQINLGLRLEKDFDPISEQSNFVRLDNDFFDEAASENTVTTPYNQLITTNHQAAFANYTPFYFEPRIGFTWSPKEGSNTVVRGGFGMFTDVFPGVIADNLFGNYPLTINVSTKTDLNWECGLPGGVAGLPCGPGYPTGLLPTVNLTQPGLPDSATTMASNTAANYKSGFTSNYQTLGAESVCTACTGLNAGMAPPNFTNAAQNIHYPTYEEYSLQVEHQFSRSLSMNVGYVGNHGTHEPVQNVASNAYDASFVGLPTAPPAPGFGYMNQIYTEGMSNYNGLIVSVVHRSHILTLQGNYAWSHTLDDVSNGGISPFGFGNGNISYQIDPYNLRYNYGNADYDSRNVLNGNYLIDIPHWRGPRLAVDGWTLSGTFFYNSGYPFTLVDSAATPVAFGEYYPDNTIPAAIAPGSVTSNRCGINKSNPTAVCSAFANAFANNDITPATSFGTQERNQFLGPHYFDTDFGVVKSFPLGGWEGANLKIGAQLFNILNHPNFAQPNGDVNATGFGNITSMANPPTSIFGSFLGGDASPRLVQFKGVITF